MIVQLSLEEQCPSFTIVSKLTLELESETLHIQESALVLRARD